MSDYSIQANQWNYESMFTYSDDPDGLKIRNEYYLINLFAYPIYRLNVWRVHAFYDGYKMPGIKGEIYRVDAELPFDKFMGKTTLDVVEYCQQYVDRDIQKFKEDNG